MESIEDVVDALGYIGEQLKEDVCAAAGDCEQQTVAADASRFKLSDCEKKIYNCLGKEPSHIEQIICETDLPAGSINAALVSLRLKGLIKQLPGSMFLRN